MSGSRRKALLICYYFPPLGLGGVGRPLNLFKNLPRHGWDCDILTVKPVLYRAYEPELLEGLDQSRIYRSGSRDPQRLLYLLGMRKVKSGTISKARPVSEKFFPDSKIGWAKPALRLGRTLIENNGYDAIVSSSPPMTSHLIGRQLASEFELPWVADFRDFWTIYKVEDAYEDPKLVEKGQALLKHIASEASAITAVNQSIADYLGRGETLTNGYISELAEGWRNAPNSAAFTIGMLGHLHDTREIEPLLNVLSIFQQKYPDLFAGLNLLQVGQVDEEWLRNLFREHDLPLELDIRGQVPRHAVSSTLRSAHLFYYGISSREGTGFLPGRTFDLIASGRPVMAFAPDISEPAKVLTPIEGNVCFQPHTIDRAVEMLHHQVTLFQKGEYRFDPLSDHAQQYSSLALARKFADVLEAAL